MSLRTRKIKASIVPYILIAPSVALVAIFLYGVAQGVLQGFGVMPFLGMTDPTVAYFKEALGRSDLLESLAFSFSISVISSVGAVIGGIVLSAVLTQLKSMRFLRVLNVSIPLMTAHALVALMAVSLFSGSGLFPRFLHVLGLADSVNSFSSIVGEPSGWGIMLVYLWKEIPFVAFCVISIMEGVSARYGEAAMTLGASPLRNFFSVTLPLCKGAILKAFLVVFAFSFGAYEVPFLLGPTLPKALPVLAYVEFQNPDIMNRCYAMAINSLMVFICSALAAVYFAVLQREKRM